MFNTIAKYWPHIVAATIIFAILNISLMMVRSCQPVPTSSTVAQASGSISVESASVSTSVSELRGSNSSESSESKYDDSETRTVTREKFRVDGSLESRVVEKVEKNATKIEKSIARSTESIAIVKSSTQSYDAVQQSSGSFEASVSTIVSDSSAGIGPVLWATPVGVYAGLSYKILDIPLGEINVSVVAGTEVNALPDLKLATGGFASKTISPGLELGLVGVVSIPALEPQLGVGFAYHF